MANASLDTSRAPQPRCPTTPRTTFPSADNVSNTPSSKLGHTLNIRFSFGFQPNVDVGAMSTPREPAASKRAASHVGSSARTDSTSMTRFCESRKLNKKFEYPPARNSPAFKAMFGPNTTRGPESFISKFKSAQSTVRLAPSGPTICAPQHASSKSPAETGVVVKVVAFPSSRTNRENSYCIVTPFRFTSRSTSFEIKTLAYVSRAPRSARASTPTRSIASLGAELHAYASIDTAPASNASQFAFEKPPSTVPSSTYARRANENRRRSVVARRRFRLRLGATETNKQNPSSRE